ncbi:MAG TPA: hypothetical protein PKE47_16780, partial [Verrucomicrobiota bacterium]|nr:hypothetical protein [Verrucomicrobiota bacterium]
MRPSLASRLVGLAVTALAACAAAAAVGAEATPYRAINLNGPAGPILGRDWEGRGAPNLKLSGKEFENQAVLLRPPTDPAKAQMIRSSLHGSRVEVELTDVPAGTYQVFAYVWEDNHSEQFDL